MYYHLRDEQEVGKAFGWHAAVFMSIGKANLGCKEDLANTVLAKATLQRENLKLQLIRNCWKGVVWVKDGLYSPASAGAGSYRWERWVEKVSVCKVRCKLFSGHGLAPQCPSCLEGPRTGHRI